MFENRLQKRLKEGESAVLMVRKYPLVFLGQIIFSSLFIIAPFFFLFPLLRWGGWGVLIFFVGLVIGIGVAVRIFVEYSFNVFLITDTRIIDIDQKGFFDKTVSETTYDKIQDVSFRTHGVMQTLLHFGSVIIQTAGQQANIELHGVKNPEHVQQAIIEIQREKKEHSGISAEELTKAIALLQEKNNEQDSHN